MKLDETKYSIAEIIDMLKQRTLVVNSDYQRAPRIWPNTARSYFIDTILSGYPFPKIFFYEMIDRKSKRPLREIVDGQQRITCIQDFHDEKFKLGRNSRRFEGQQFSTLPEEDQDAFLSYTVSVDVIRNAERPEILQMFRRMNAYTLPLNDAEKRHAEYFGEFKDWINRQLDRQSELLSSWGILSERQILRMQDAEMFAELVIGLEEGPISSSPAKLLTLYKKYDENFSHAEEYEEKINGAFLAVSGSLGELRNSYMTKDYVFESLILALIHNKWGIPAAVAKLDIQPSGQFFTDFARAVQNLIALATAHETKDLTTYRAYVEACTEGSNRERQRTDRLKYICLALQDRLPH